MEKEKTASKKEKVIEKIEPKTKTKFEIAYQLDVNSKTEKKANLTYLSWAWAWAEFKKIYPEAKYEIKKFGEKQLPYVFDEDTGYMVFTEVEAGGEKHEMWLPVMDFRNKAMKKGEATMFDINKTLMRCLTKNLAMFGLGLYIYAGEDLPEADNQTGEAVEKKDTTNYLDLLKGALFKAGAKNAPEAITLYNNLTGNSITELPKANGEEAKTLFNELLSAPNFQK